MVPEALSNACGYTCPLFQIWIRWAVGMHFWCLVVEALSRLEQRACVRWLLYDSEDENLGPVNAIK